MATEADTCRRYVLPKLYAAGWTDDQISEQRTFTDGRIMVAGTKVWRRPQKRADYLLRYRSNLMVAVVEAKASHKGPADGLQQAKEYAQILDLKFAYAANGHGIVEHDFLWTELLRWQTEYFGLRSSKKVFDLLSKAQEELAKRVIRGGETAASNLELYALLETLRHPDTGVSFRIALPNLRLMKGDGQPENEYDVVSVSLKEDKHVEV